MWIDAVIIAAALAISLAACSQQPTRTPRAVAAITFDIETESIADTPDSPDYGDEVRDPPGS